MISKVAYPMTLLLALMLILVGVPAVTVADASAQDQCIACHLDVEDEVAIAYKNDVHYIHNISCADCHGGDRTADDEDIAMNPQKGYIGVPKKAMRDRCLPPVSRECRTDEKLRQFHQNQTLYTFSSKCSRTITDYNLHHLSWRS